MNREFLNYNFFNSYNIYPIYLSIMTLQDILKDKRKLSIIVFITTIIVTICIFAVLCNYLIGCMGNDNLGLPNDAKYTSIKITKDGQFCDDKVIHIYTEPSSSNNMLLAIVAIAIIYYLSKKSKETKTVEVTRKIVDEMPDLEPVTKEEKIKENASKEEKIVIKENAPSKEVKK